MELSYLKNFSMYEKGDNEMCVILINIFNYNTFFIKYRSLITHI